MNLKSEACKVSDLKDTVHFQRLIFQKMLRIVAPTKGSDRRAGGGEERERGERSLQRKKETGEKEREEGEEKQEKKEEQNQTKLVV